MNRKRTLERSNESGQSLIMFALFLIGLLGMLALVLDGGNIYLMRRRMQNAADAGALAGAREMALEHGETAARSVAEEYAIYRDGADRADISFENEGKIIWVTAHKDVPMTFAVILGIEEVTVSARAAAIFAGLGEGYIAPIALYEEEDQIVYRPCCEEGQDPGDPLDPDYPICYEDPVDCTWIFWDDTTEDETGYLDHQISGNLRGWATCTCAGCDPGDPECPPEDAAPECGDAGSNLLAEWMIEGCPDIVAPGMWLRGDNGVKNHPVAITQARVGDVLLIALYKDYADLYPGKAYFEIKRLIPFLVTDVMSTGNPKGIEGMVITWNFAGPIDPNSEGPARTIRLIH